MLEIEKDILFRLNMHHYFDAIDEGPEYTRYRRTILCAQTFLLI